jgi:hypothetical protein
VTAALTSLSSKHPQYRKRWQLDHDRGITRTVPSGPVVAHLEQLVAAGATRTGIAEAAGISKTGVCRILRGDQPTVRRVVARALLAVDLAAIVHRDRDRGFVPSIGSRRRVQALMAIGWRHQDMNAWLRANAPQTGHRSNLILSKPGDLLERRTADAVRALYDALWSTPGPSASTRARSAAKGWVPPLAWDDDTIDDPAVRPAGVDDLTGRRGRDQLVDEAEDLADMGEHLATAAHRLGITADNLERTLYRAGRHDLVARLKGRTPTQEATA